MEVKGFKAFRFNKEVVGDTGSCISPPYDVISADQQQQLYEKNEYNAIRIIKGKTEPSDNDSNNQYTRAADYLKAWIENGALSQDERESIYGYVQNFKAGGTQFQRLSFVGLAKLEEFGKIVRPHEQILKKPMIDRLNLKRATRATLGLIFMLYEDPTSTADKIIERACSQEAVIDFVDEQNVRHRLFAISEKPDVDAITAMMADKSGIIADGHHRYTTGLTYSKENNDPAAKYQMLAFCNTSQEGLIVLATHRLVNNLESFDFEKLIGDLGEKFEVTEYPFDSPEAKSNAREKMLSQMKAESQSDKNAFGIYGGDGRFCVAVLRNAAAMDDSAANMSRAWRTLDVSVLHKLILEKVLGIDEERLAKGGNVEYVKDMPQAIDESIERVDEGEKQVALFMNPPKIRQIQMVADEGERMPQKSTYFYPKVYSGLTIYKL